MTDTQLSDGTVSEIRFFSQIARANRSHVSLRDIAMLTSISYTEMELRERWNSVHQLFGTYRLEQDILLDSDSGVPEDPTSALAREAEKRARAQDYLTSARQFFRLSRDSSTRLVSVSGSTSYFSAHPSDDLDFFVISAKDHLWTFLFKSLILARAFRILHPNSPRVCFSYATEEDFAEKKFAEGDPLLARDALSVVVLQGETYYQRLIKQNKWISDYFPKLYRTKTELNHLDRTESEPAKSSVVRRSINLLLYFCVGQYIRVKSDLLNRQFLRKGFTQSLFTVRSGPDHCIFDSHRYSKLRQMYSQLSPTILTDRPSPGSPPK